MTNYCRDCDFVHPDTRKQEPWRWRCVRVPTKPGFGFVDPEYSPTPPYELCKFLRANVGEICPSYAPRRAAPEKAIA